MKQELIEKTKITHKGSILSNRYTFIYNRYIQKIFEEQGICLEDKIDNLGNYFSETSIYMRLKLSNGLECTIYFKETNYIYNAKIHIDFYDTLLCAYSLRNNKFINYNYVYPNQYKDIENLIKVLTEKVDFKEKLESKLPQKQIKVGVKKI